MVQKISHELRSEKAKNIISPIPIKLIKYGTLSIISGVLLLVLLMTFIPIKDSISGKIYIDKILLQSPDSIYAMAYADFTVVLNENINLLRGRQIELDRNGYKMRGVIEECKQIFYKSNNDDYVLYLSLPNDNIENFNSRISSFLVEIREVSILRKLISSIKIKPN